MEMKGRVQVIHEDQDRDLENRDQRRINTVFKKGNTQGYMEIRDETRTKTRMRMRRGQDEVEDEMRTRRGRGQDEVEVKVKTRRGQ